MSRRQTAYVVAGVLAAEAALLVAMPGRVPRAVRALAAVVDLGAAAGLWSLARQRPSGK